MEYPELGFILPAIILLGLVLSASVTVSQIVLKQEERFATTRVRIAGVLGVLTCYALLVVERLLEASTTYVAAVIASYFLAPLVGWFLSRSRMPWWSRVIGWLGIGYPVAFFLNAVLARTAV